MNLEPQIGDIVYVPSSNKIVGGKIIITNIHEDVSANNLVHFVGSDFIKITWNYQHYLLPIQEKLKEQFGNSFARKI